MISNQCTSIKVLENNELTKHDDVKFQMQKNHRQEFSTISKPMSMKTNSSSSNNSIVTSTQNSDNSQMNSEPSTLMTSWNLFSRSKNINKDKVILNEYNSNLILTKKKQNRYDKIDQLNTKSDYLDWTRNSQLKTLSIEKTINNQLKALDCLKEYLKNANKNTLIDLIHIIAQEITKDNKYSAINNNHLDSIPLWNSNIQLSNNKEKKTKKEKSTDKERKDSYENTLNEIKKKKKHEQKEKVEETTTDSDTDASQEILKTPTRVNFNNPKSPSYSPDETIGFQTLSIPIPQSNISPNNSFLSPDSPSPIRIPQQSNIAQLSQVQQQLQTNSHQTFIEKNTSTPSHPNVSVQQQLQSLSQMARDGDEVLITLTVNALTHKPQINNNNYHHHRQETIQNSKPYSLQSYYQMTSPPTELIMPRNLEIVAKGFARIQNEHPQPPSSNLYSQYPQQPIMPHPYTQTPHTYMSTPFLPRHAIPRHTYNNPPQAPIGPPIQPIFAPPHMTAPGGFVRPPNNNDFSVNRRNDIDIPYKLPHTNNVQCDYLCQSSLNQPDFRGRPPPGSAVNSYALNQPSRPMNFSAKRSSKHKSNQIHKIKNENIHSCINDFNDTNEST